MKWNHLFVVGFCVLTSSTQFLLAGHGEEPAKEEKKEPAPKKVVHLTTDVSTALDDLIKGNERFVAHKLEHPHQSEGRVAEIAESQKPIAIVVCCSDSRVPPEIVFDQGLGDLFVIRSAGQVLGDAAIGSIEYALEHFNVKLLMVLGHERCGAITVAKEVFKAGTEVPGHMETLVRALRPAVERTQDDQGDPITNAVKANVKIQMEALKKNEPIISEHVKKKGLRIVGAFYDLDTGLVTNVD